MNIKIFKSVANAALTIMLIIIIAMAGFDNRQKYLGSRYLQSTASIFHLELKALASEDGGERSGWVSEDDESEFTNNFVVGAITRNDHQDLYIVVLNVNSYGTLKTRI